MSELTGLSILIPIYNQDVRPLINQLLEQLSRLSIPAEIRCYDDGSDTAIKLLNQELRQNKSVVYMELPLNIGRSAIRNKLAQEAAYPQLLLLDGNVEITKKDFLETYIKQASQSPVLIGGSVYDYVPETAQSLRWKYGKSRESKPAVLRSAHPYRGITLKNILIRKEVYLQNPLDESIRTYGHEDTKFAYMLKEKKVTILHIENPVRHINLDNNEVFIGKTLDGVKNYYRLIREGYAGDSRLYDMYKIFRLFPFKQLFKSFYALLKLRIDKNLRSGNPSLLYFDLMKLRALLQEKESNA
ncbi:MAG: glycosyltransferase family 2 protein [Cytophagaceae bacterium]